MHTSRSEIRVPHPWFQKSWVESVAVDKGGGLVEVDYFMMFRMTPSVFFMFYLLLCLLVFGAIRQLEYLIIQ